MKNFMRARFDLMKMQQRKGEPIDVWYQQIQAQIPPCEYSKEMRAIQLRDNFILKMTDQEIVGKLSGEVKSCRIHSYESSRMSLRATAEQISKHVFAR